MKAITTIDLARFSAGAVLKLSAEQAAVRKHVLKSIGDDKFETIGPVEFKRGESFGYDGPLSRAMQEVMEVDGVAPAPKAVAIEDRKPVAKPAAKKGK